jgi:predicted amidohydrolase
VSVDYGGENLIPGFRSGGWEAWSPREALRPAFSIEEADGRCLAKISSRGGFHHYGSWKCLVHGVVGGRTYSFDVEYRSPAVEDEAVSVYALLSWVGREGRMLIREYATRLLGLGGGWRRVFLTTEAPQEASSVIIALTLRWSASGEVTWRAPWLSETDRVPHRRIRVATTYLRQRNDRRRNLEALLSILDRAGREGSDLVVTSETFVDRSCFAPEPIPGDLTRAVAAKAAEHRAYVVLSMNERSGEQYHNTAVLFDRTGGVVGTYRKTHLPLIEAEAGITPGSSYPVFETDFGTVGMLICYDHWFPETARILRVKGAEMILVSTIGDAPLQSLARAADNALPVVVAGADGPAPSRIIDVDGKILGEIPTGDDGVCVREIDLDERRLQRWLSVGDADGDPRNLFVKERRTDTYAAELGPEPEARERT